jgi:hypothetical protein
MNNYLKVIEKLCEQAREHADRLAESDSDKSSARSDALEAFADSLEAAIEELSSDWENA